MRLLIDAGISGKQAHLRLAAEGIDISTIDAVLISHDHRDHVACAGIYQRKFGLPLWMTPATLAASHQRQNLGQLSSVQHFTAGGSMSFGSITVEAHATPHDADDGCCFVIDDGQRRLGVLTDLGHPFAGLDDIISDLDAVVLESNYDPAMLQQGPYPAFLKARVAGDAGHISNIESADLVARAGGRLQWVALAHLSGENNTPCLAKQTHTDRTGGELAIYVTSRDEATAVWDVK